MMIDRNVVSTGFALLEAGPRIRNARSEAGMWSAPVIMRDPLFEKTPQMPFIHRDQEVQTFAANCTDHSLTKSVVMSVQLRRIVMLRFDVSE
jgi:hypothetical protein